MQELSHLTESHLIQPPPSSAPLHEGLLSASSVNQQMAGRSLGYSAINKHLRSLGSVFTPVEIAIYLSTWSIRQPDEKILDLGVGDGVFVWSSFQRLLSLGASVDAAQNQIFGAEVHDLAFNQLTETAREHSLSFPNIQQGDFLKLDFPEVDTIIGNPPYVRRHYFDNIESLRQSVLEKLPKPAISLSKMTDLYIYFLLRASAYLKEGGRLAVIVADSWLSVNYGQEFKTFLQQNFEIEHLISFDRKIFSVDVRPVIILAHKRSKMQKNSTVNFIRVRNGFPLIDTTKSIDTVTKSKDADVFSIQQSSLNAKQTWHRYFSDANLLKDLYSHPLMTCFKDQARTRIGVQTLAKEFFVLTPEQVKKHEIEPEYTAPLIHSIRSITDMVIEPDSNPAHYLFLCGKDKANLSGTNTLRYILEGEAATVPVRGKNRNVIGYHNKERIQKDHRPHWYDLTREVSLHKNATILIPRLIYKNLVLVWNKANYIPGELFIEFILPENMIAEAEIFLAILSSSVLEIIIRSRSQVYGGGTYNISPGLIKEAPLIDVGRISKDHKQQLRTAYNYYVENPRHDKSAINDVVYKILNIDKNKQGRLHQLLEDMTSGKEKVISRH